MADTNITSTPYGVDNLVIEAGEIVERTILTGQTLTRGMLLTKDGDGKYVKTVADGNIDGIVKEDITTTADTVANIYYTGVYDLETVENATGITVTEAMQDTARANGIMVGTR